MSDRSKKKFASSVRKVALGEGEFEGEGEGDDYLTGEERKTENCKLQYRKIKYFR
jgi:hypothetical protein